MSRTNFSEAFQILVHLKVLHLFVESVLRYGLPKTYVGVPVGYTGIAILVSPHVRHECQLMRAPYLCSPNQRRSLEYFPCSTRSSRTSPLFQIAQGQRRRREESRTRTICDRSSCTKRASSLNTKINDREACQLLGRCSKRCLHSL